MGPALLGLEGKVTFRLLLIALKARLLFKAPHTSTATFRVLLPVPAPRIFTVRGPSGVNSHHRSSRRLAAAAGLHFGIHSGTFGPTVGSLAPLLGPFWAQGGAESRQKSTTGQKDPQMGRNWGERSPPDCSF